ncbi:hypothetical protein AV530_001756 [Patagioenas fasciata monilis]|uniref:Uncharacterized protein n=1 Tax=Patagioenas fasciata monilis TaxID=372326 RepID=A0A1V4KM70_PATFA|nr:hypothetical protein AV530_001756 [Patagioenas fasciata monilis]
MTRFLRIFCAYHETNMPQAAEHIFLVTGILARCGLGFLHEQAPSCRSQLINLCTRLRSYGKSRNIP